MSFWNKIFDTKQQPPLQSSRSTAPSPWQKQEPETSDKWVVVTKTSAVPFPLYLKTRCSSLETMEMISAQEWNRFIAHAAYFSEATAKLLAAQAMKSGAKECSFEAAPFTLKLLAEDCNI